MTVLLGFRGGAHVPAVGEEMHEWAKELWGIPRSLTGNGVRQTLNFLQGVLPDLRIHEVPSGSPAMDWVVPDEWNVRSAFVEDLSGNRIIDWAENNLHLVGYSVPFDGVVSREELNRHLHSWPEQPNAIPYVTSYYDRRWGFCLADELRVTLTDDRYRVFIDSSLTPGHLTFGDLVLPGRSDQEVLFSTYVCHPSMANNELSGPVVLAALARSVSQLEERWYTYRFLFSPETIGALIYLEQHLNHLRDHVRAGIVVTCVGDERTYSYLPSRLGRTMADRLLIRELEKLDCGFTEFQWTDRGSDERQWCAPGVDLPVCSFSRSKYGEYPEYHSSLDDLSLVTPTGLADSLSVLESVVGSLERSPRYRTRILGEPQMGRRGLYPTLSTRDATKGPLSQGGLLGYSTRDLMNVLSHCDGSHDAQDIAMLVGLEPALVNEILGTLRDNELVARA